MNNIKIETFAPNHFVIRDNNTGEIKFQSDSIIIYYKNEFGTEFLDCKFHKRSKKTIKYRNQFLKKTTKEIEKAIKANEIYLIDLNANS